MAVRLLDHGVPVATGEAAIRLAADRLRVGEVVAIPTDTVYGIAAALDRPGALTEVFRIKGRPDDRSLPILVAGPNAIGSLLNPTYASGKDTHRLLRLADRFWPGGLTVALPARADLPASVLAPDGSAGFRVPDDPTTLALLRQTGGALAVTSANRSGDPTPASPDQIADRLGASPNPLRWVLASGPRAGSPPSTVISASCDGESLVVHRDGAIPSDAILAAWADVRLPWIAPD